jgi:pimeloyl-ACP methyl ester carboxylesterase
MGILPAVLYFFLILLFILCAGTAVSYVAGSTPPFESPGGGFLDGSIASLERIRLGGVRQAVLIRGKRVDNPLLLFLHGGPGTSEMAWVRRFNSALEEKFIVVNWDQRKAGKSFSPFIPAGSMTPEQFVSDAHELMEILCKRFGKKKIFIVGHSWGSVLGTMLAQKHPRRIAAYVGVGQVVDLVENERISHRFALETARRENNARAVRILEKMRNYPLTVGTISDLRRQRKLLIRFGGALFGERSLAGLFKAFLGPEHTIFDLLPFLAGSIFSILDMWKGLLQTVHFMETALIFQVPVYFCIGRHDFNTPFELAEKYFNALQAPKKELIWFERSAHSPCFEEPEKFCNVLIDTVLRDCL